MNWMFYAFPLMFLLFVGFFGFIGYSILVRKKPVLIASNLLVILLALGFLPSLVWNLTTLDVNSSLFWVQLLMPTMMVFLLVFYASMMKGFSLYGIETSAFREHLLASLAHLGVATVEEMSRIKLVDHETELSVSFQDSLGTGMVRVKHPKKFSLKPLHAELRRRLEGASVATKRVTAYFYLGFALLMLLASGAFVFLLLIEKF